MDKFYEQFMTKDYGKLPKVMQIIFYVSLLFFVVSVSLFIFLGIIGIAIAISSLIVAIYAEVFSRKVFLEYEYEYFEGEITISKIINKKSRKIIATFNLEQIIKVSKPNLSEKVPNVINACIKNIPNNTELIFYTNGANKQVYYLSIDEKFFEILKKEKPSIFNYI